MSEMTKTKLALVEAQVVIKERTHHLKVAHLHVQNYEALIVKLEAEICMLKGEEGSLPIPGRRKELAVTEEQCPVWNRHMDVGNGKIAARRVKVAEMMKKGWPPSSMAKLLGMSVETVRLDVRAIKAQLANQAASDQPE